jgi:hypothetical protein
VPGPRLHPGTTEIVTGATSGPDQTR